VETQVDAGMALKRVGVEDFEVVISDLRMPAMDGVSFLRGVAQVRPHSVRMMLTGSADFETSQRAINEAGVFRYLCKPWRDDELATHIDSALAHSAALREQSAHARAWQDQLRTLTPQEVERRRLEEMEPGITRVEWGPNGEVLMPPLTPNRNR
jgi:response regulator RpfG family c-di-GMP phosphodiesterase